MKDSMILRDTLVTIGNDVEFQEYDYGHLGLIMPAEDEINDNMLASIMNVTD